MSYEENYSRHPVHFSAKSDLQKWVNLGYVDFAELFRGFGELSIRVREAGCTTSEGFDKYALTYDRCWCLDQKGDQGDCAWLLVYSLKPKVVHLGTPCTKMCRLGKQEIDEATKATNEFTKACCEHQLALKLLAGVENPKGTILHSQPDWIAAFGDPATRDNSWKLHELDGCQLGSVYPGDDDFGAPQRKSQVWLANFDLSGMELRCRRPLALAGSSHDHRRIRGRMHVEGKSFEVAEYSGKYSPELATVYAKEAKRACDLSLIHI